MTTLERLQELQESNKATIVEIEYFPEDDGIIIDLLNENDFIKVVLLHERIVFYITHDNEDNFINTIDNADIDEKICYAEFIVEIDGRLLRYKDMKEVGPGPIQKQTTPKNIHELQR